MIKGSVFPGQRRGARDQGNAAQIRGSVSATEKELPVIILDHECKSIFFYIFKSID